MNKNILIVLLFSCSFNCNSLPIFGKDSLLGKEYRFTLHHEILSPFIYPLIIGGDNKNMDVVAWKYFTGGVRYNISKKNEIGFDYLFFEKQINTKHQDEEVPGFFGSIVNPNFSYDAPHHIYQQKYIWVYYRRNFRHFFASCGFGGGTYTYKNNNKNNSVFEKNHDWCDVIDLGYNVKIYKNITISCYLGMLNAFSFKKEITYDKPILNSSDVIYNYEVEQFKDLKKVEISNSSHITRTYKNMGIMQSKIIPRLGVSLVFQF